MNKNTSKGTVVQCNLHWCIKNLSLGMKNRQPREEALNAFVDQGAFWTSTAPYWLKLRSMNVLVPEFAVNEGEHFIIEQWLQKRPLLDGIGTPSCFSSEDWPVIQDPTTTSMESEFAQPVVESPLDKIFANLAAGATTYIRQSGGSSQLNIADFRQRWREVDYDEDLALGHVPMDEALGTANETSWQRETQLKAC